LTEHDETRSNGSPGAYTLGRTQVAGQDADDVARKMLATFSSAGYRPPALPSVAMEILKLAEDPRVSFNVIATTLEKDQLIAGRVLSLARSPFYCTTNTEITSLKHAITRFGLRMLVDIVTEVALEIGVFQTQGYVVPMQRVARHCRATAHLARMLGKLTAFPAEQAFLCGLFHDVGYAGMLVILGEEWRPPALDPLWPGLDRIHAEASAQMVNLWQLSSTVEEIARTHHLASASQPVEPLAAIVCEAEALANELGFGIAGLADQEKGKTLDTTHPTSRALAWDRLELTSKQLDEVRAKAAEILPALA